MFRSRIGSALSMLSVSLVGWACAQGSTQLPARAVSTLVPGRAPIIIAHRGASGHLPEHTIEGYSLAIDMGADFVEPDLVSTKDGILVARHENEISGTTDVAAKFPERKRIAVVDGDTVRGWFIEDFMLAELKTLRARERIASRSHVNDGRFLVPTFDELLDLVRRREHETGRIIGVYPETKHSSYFAGRGLALEPKVLDALARHGYGKRSDAVFIQSFEVGNLRALRAEGAPYQLVQLIDSRGMPADFKLQGIKRSYRDLITPDGLREIATYADAIGVDKGLVIPIVSGGNIGETTSLVRDAHAAGLAVHVWETRSDAPFLASGWKNDPSAEWRAFVAAGVDGIFTDFPDDGVRALRSPR
ncbi:MAG: glycerophosphodiester phosphodiesterase [Gemmatimonadaceae bacterium]